jgi:hypothetical protein
MSGVNNNGLQSANGIAALFIATGQGAAIVAESSAALGDYYASITLPSPIVPHTAAAPGSPPASGPDGPDRALTVRAIQRSPRRFRQFLLASSRRPGCNSRSGFATRRFGGTR